MSSKAYDISLIKGYLRGKLDNHAMYKMERAAQDDPFLMDALDGYHLLGNCHFSLDELKARLDNHLQRSKRKVFLMWPLIATIIAVLVFAVLGVWWLLVYLPQIKNHHHKAQNLKHAVVEVRTMLHPQNSSKPQSNTVKLITDTTLKDTAAKRNTAKTQQSQKPRDPSAGTVDPSTVIADLNKAPYSIAKSKAKPTAATSNSTGPLIPTGKKDLPVTGSAVVKAGLKNSANNKALSNVKTTANQHKLPIAQNAANAITTNTNPAVSGKNLNVYKKADHAVASTQSGLQAVTSNVAQNANSVKITNPVVTAGNKTASTNKLDNGIVGYKMVTPGTNNKAENNSTVKNAVPSPQKNNSVVSPVAGNNAVTNNPVYKTSVTTKSTNQPGTQTPEPTFTRENTRLANANSSGAILQNSRITTAPAIKNTDILNVSGQVVAADNGKPIAGVALRIMGSQLGTVTDANGKFTIQMAHDQVLQANYVGYFGKEIVPAGTTMKILLQPVKNISNESVSPKAAVTNEADTKPIVAGTTSGTSRLNVAAAINTKPLMHVSGRVLASATNLPVPNVVMWNRNANEQYRLEADGVFDIVVHKGDEIYAGHKGFKTQKIKIRGSTHFDVILEENDGTLFDGFSKALVIEPFDDAAHPAMGWRKFGQYQTIKSAEGKTGTVKIDFIVNADNSVSNIKVTKSVSAAADSTAINIIRIQTKWSHNASNQPENLSVKFKVD